MKRLLKTWSVDHLTLSSCVCSKKKKLLSPSVFKYKVRMIKDEDGTPFIVKAIQIRWEIFPQSHQEHPCSLRIEFLNWTYSGIRRQSLSWSCGKHGFCLFKMCLLCFSRRKSTLSRERLKLFLKHHCEPKNGTIIVKVTGPTHITVTLCLSNYNKKENVLIFAIVNWHGNYWSNDAPSGQSMSLREIWTKNSKQSW